MNWYRQEMMTEGDNPPVGILLCTDKNHALVEYALAGMDNQLFVSKYLLELPDKEEIQRFVDVYYSYIIFSLKKPVDRKSTRLNSSH